MNTYSLHTKTITALSYFRQTFSSGNRRLDDTENLYEQALSTVALQCYSILKANNKERITVSLAPEVNRAFYLLAMRAQHVLLPEHLTCFPSFQNGIDELLEDLENVREQNRGVVSLTYTTDPAIVKRRIALSKKCKVVG